MPACARVLALLETAVKDNNGVPSVAPSDLRAGIDAPFKSTNHLVYSASLFGAGALGLWFLLLLASTLFSREGAL
jgi:hypothetical protein